MPQSRPDFRPQALKFFKRFPHIEPLNVLTFASHLGSSSPEEKEILESLDMKKVIVGFVAIAALSGCMQLAEISSEPASAQLKASVPQERLNPNTSKMTVRAFQPGAKANTRGNEIVGARCSLVSDELNATVITPQVVILPKFKQRVEFADRGVPGSIAISCKAGKSQGKTVVTAQPKQVSTAVGGGLVAAIITTAVTAAAASSTPWTYPPAVNVVIAE